MPRLGAVANWREAQAYAPLFEADRSIFAWEWLRRDPGYREAALEMPGGARAVRGASRWGLVRFEDPSLGAPHARPVWRADVHPYVLQATARPASAAEDAFDPRRLAGRAAFVADKSGSTEHWLFSDGLRAVRLDLLAGSASHGPVELHYLLAGRASVAAPLLTLRRLLFLLDDGRFSRSLHPRAPQARRWILALRARDALAAGAAQREIAAILFGGAAAEARWRVHAASLRAQAQRLVRQARILARGGYRTFLG